MKNTPCGCGAVHDSRDEARACRRSVRGELRRRARESFLGTTASGRYLRRRMRPELAPEHVWQAVRTLDRWYAEQVQAAVDDWVLDRRRREIVCVRGVPCLWSWSARTWMFHLWRCDPESCRLLPEYGSLCCAAPFVSQPLRARGRKCAGCLDRLREWNVPADGATT